MFKELREDLNSIKKIQSEMKLSQRLLMWFSFFWIIFSSCCSDWLLFASLRSKIIYFILSFIHSTVVSL